MAFSPLFFSTNRIQAAQPIEQWKEDYKTCVYTTCTEHCQSLNCGDCAKNCALPVLEGGVGYYGDYKGMLHCLKNCGKTDCPKMKTYDCENCKLDCKNQHKFKGQVTINFRGETVKIRLASWQV